MSNWGSGEVKGLERHIKGLVRQHTTGPGDDKGLARVEDMVNWAFESAGLTPPRRIVLRWTETGDCIIDFAPPDL